MRICHEKFQHTSNRDAHASNARFPATLPRLNSDAIESADLRHVSSVAAPSWLLNKAAFLTRRQRILQGFEQPVFVGLHVLG